MSEDTRLKELIINTLSPEQMPEVLSETEIYLVEDDAEYATVEELATKQDVITDLEQIRSNASNAKSTVDTHVANTTIHVTAQDKVAWSNKQNAISDLENIRTNASTGAGLAPQVAVNTQRIEDLTTARIPDVIYHGTPKITGGQISNFSTTNYLQFPFEDISRSLPFDIYFSFTTSADVATQQNIIDSRFGIALAIQNGKGVMALSSNGSSWDIGSATGTNTLLPNTTYYVKYSWTGTEYNASLSTNDQTYVPDMILQSNKSPYKTTIYIGGCDQEKTGHTPHPFKGIINFTKSRVVVNGITVWEGMADVGIASRANVSLNNLDEVGEKRFTDLQNNIDEKQDIITDIDTIRSNAEDGKSANDTISTYGDIVTHNANEFQLAGDYATNTALTNGLATKQNTISDLATIRSRANNSVQYNVPTTRGLYLRTHGELQMDGVTIPFIHNDLAFFNKKGGTLKFARRTEDGEFEEYTQSGADYIVNGKPNYCMPDPRGYYEFQITCENINKARSFNYGNLIYIDFGTEGMRADRIKIEYKRSNTDWLVASNVTNENSAYYVNSDGSSTGLTGIRFTLRPANRTSQYNFRVAQIGIINYDSDGAGATYLNRGGGTLYGNVSFASGSLVGYQKTIDDLSTIRSGASKGATALQSIPIAKANVVGGVAGGNWLTVNQTTGKMECGELTKAQYDSANGYTFISKTTLENRLVDKQDKLVSGTNIKTINGESVLGSGNFDVSSIEPLSQEEYDRRKEAGELDENKYYSTPTDISLQVLEALYPIGSLYLTTTSTCPLATLGIGTWQLEIEEVDNCVIETGEQNGIKYRIWQDGYCEQCGYYYGTSDHTDVSLVKQYNSDSYNISAIADNYAGVAGSFCMTDQNSATVNGFRIIANFYGTVPTNKRIRWKTSGYLTAGQYTPKTETTKKFRRIA